jgi:hypothetical protein
MLTLYAWVRLRIDGGKKSKDSTIWMLTYFVCTNPNTHNQLNGQVDDFVSYDFVEVSWTSKAEDGMKGTGSIHIYRMPLTNQLFSVTHSFIRSMPIHAHLQVWGGSLEESNAKVMAFFESSHFQVKFKEVMSWVYVYIYV